MRNSNWQDEIARDEARRRKAREILGVPDNADRDEIRRAFRRASLAHHPDRNRGDADAARRFHRVQCAYRFLMGGEPCDALDEVEVGADNTTPFRTNTAWGYWCWWRDTYFGDSR